LKNWKIILAILTANVVFMSASYTMLIPFLPMYLVRELGVSQSEVTMWSGVVFSVTFLIGGIMAPVWGKMADTHGKKPMAIRSGLGLALSYLLGGMVTSPEQMVGVRVLQGFAAGLWSVCLAIATSSVPVGKLGMSLGILQSGLTAGNVIGPLIGGVLASMFGMRTSFYLGGAVLFMITLVFWFYIPEPPGSKAYKEEAANEPATALLKNAPIREALICSGIVQMVILLIQPIISLYVEKLYHGTDNIIFVAGLVFSLVGIASAMTAPFWGRFGQNRGFYLSLALSSVCAGVVMIMQSVPSSLLLFAALNFTVGLFFAGIQPSISAILANKTERTQRGRVFGMLFSAQQFGSMVGPLIGGLIASFLPMNSLFVIGGCILILIAAFIYNRHRGEALNI
jgi:DHA1 family multidrug resistance protein-like MFS transporter